MRINGLRDIIDKYDSFIIDIYGVLHDGIQAYDGVHKALDLIKKHKKVFLSNAPRPSEIIQNRLQQIGINIPRSEILTSGQFFLRQLEAGLLANKRVFILGEASNSDLLKGVTINRAESLKKADCVLMLMFAEHKEEVEESYEQMKEALSYKLEFYCPNPDKVVKHGDGIRYTGGYFAKIYEELGGVVHYYGKPYKQIYDYAMKNFGLKNPLCIGDALETDVLGAKNSKLDSLLLQSGIHEKEHNMEKLFTAYNIRPTYFAKSFRV